MIDLERLNDDFLELQIYTYRGSAKGFTLFYFICCTEESTTVLRKAESEYKGHRSLLMRTRNLLSTMQRQDVLDRLNIKQSSLVITSIIPKYIIHSFEYHTLL